MESTLIFIFMVLAYAIGKVFFERRLAKMEETQNRFELENLAFARSCSVYDIFQDAAEKWNFSHSKSEQDFKDYLKDGVIPPYVHEYCRHDPHANDRSYQNIFLSGGGPPLF